MYKYIFPALLALAMVSCADGDKTNPTKSDVIELTATLSSAQLVPRVQSDASGSANIRVNLSTGEISGTVEFFNMEATIAHIHKAYAGSNGAPIVPLNKDGAVFRVPDGTVLNAADLASLKSGELYVNVHSVKLKGGEIRAQLTPANIELFSVVMDGAQEVPPADTQATGYGFVTLDTDSGKIAAAAVTTNMVIQKSHIHLGNIGSTGLPITTLTINTTDPQLLELAPVAISEENINILKSEGLYLNVHSEGFPDGEIRGQIVPM